MRAVRRAILLPAAAVLLLVTGPAQGRADYKTLLREMEGYLPPAVVAAQLTPRPAVTPVLPPDNEFQGQVVALQKRQREWGKALADPRPTDSFLVPPAGLLSTLRPAANNPAIAEKALARGFTLETLEVLVLLRSPEVQAKEREFRAVLEGYSQAEDLDTILRRYASLTKSVMTGVGGMTNPDPVTFKFPFPGVLALKGEVVGQEAEAAREELERVRREAVTAIRRNHAELLYVRKALALTRSQRQLLDQLRGAVSIRYEAGTTSFQEVTAIDIEREKLGEELTTLGEEQRNTEAAIRAALALPESIAIGVPGPYQSRRGLVKLQELKTVALARRQEIRSQRAMIGRLERMLELAETMIYPNFSQGLSLFEGDEVSRVAGEGRPPGGSGEGEMEGAAGSFPVTAAAAAGFGLPKMPWFGSDDAYLRQMRQRIGSLQNELEATLAGTTLGVREGWFRFDKARRQEALYRDRVAPLSKANLDSAAKGYAAGLLGFTDLIESANGWLTTNLALARAEADVLIAGAELDAAVGVDRAGVRK